MHVLQHQPEHRAELMQVHLADIDAINRDPTFLHVIEAKQQAADGCLAGTRGAHNRHALARIDGE